MAGFTQVFLSLLPVCLCLVGTFFERGTQTISLSDFFGWGEEVKERSGLYTDDEDDVTASDFFSGGSNDHKLRYLWGWEKREHHELFMIFPLFLKHHWPPWASCRFALGNFSFWGKIIIFSSHERNSALLNSCTDPP